jgi:hypothetical protein
METKFLVKDIDSRDGDVALQLNNFSKSGWELVATSTKINKNNLLIITCIFKMGSKMTVLDLKKQLNNFILDNKKVLEDIHFTMMYSEKKQQDKEMDRLFMQTKKVIVKAQQCIDILNEI